MMICDVIGLLTVNNFAILSLIPVFDGLIYPYFHFVFSAKRSLVRRTGVGFVILVTAMLAAAILEHVRLDYVSHPSSLFYTYALEHASPCVDTDDFNPYLFRNSTAIPEPGSPALEGFERPQYCHAGCNDREITTIHNNIYQVYTMDCIKCRHIPQVSKLSVLWQIPQYFLVGVAEILTAISAINFFYEQVPPTMRSASQSFNLVTSALGMFMAVPIYFAVNAAEKPWLPNDLNEGRAADYFYLLACIMVVDVVYFWFMMRGYTEKSSEYVVTVGDQISKQETPPNLHSPATRARSSSLTGLTDLYDAAAASVSSTMHPHRSSARSLGHPYHKLLPTIDDDDPYADA